MSWSSIREKDVDLNLYPFQVGTVISLGDYSGTSNPVFNGLVMLESAGIWVITEFRFSQRIIDTAKNIRHRDLWKQPKLDKFNVSAIIDIEIEWYKFAYPHFFQPMWTIPNDFHKVFSVSGNLYQINSILFTPNSDTYSYSLSIQPLIKVDHETEREDYPQGNRTIEP